ncbi:zinc finger BED domain-containing protein RICESLEEPER 2-like [Magnolia sinica]|uniref:zinc finger BED domain-containing protein RICESLEEPER 2-like n=1 Tax=Magnolia sinica TaxID=86752 RepID=UPI002658FF3B|nr:zinc finger BED domain-containing protein RICESLEEPER 2-like [Magnolia sinica]XP_058086419.1 zinc finger BED domain-containing protein RICESLEEPER 2-like [Magnolia sinica]
MESEGLSNTPSPAPGGRSITSPMILEDEGLGLEHEEVPVDIDTSTTQSHVAGKMKKRSAVWDDFEEVTLKNGQVKIQCKHCKSQYAKQSDGSTTTLKKHISKCQKKMRSAATQQTLSFSQSAMGPLVSIYKYDKELVNELTAKLIITDERPFQMVESPAFVGLARCLNPKYEKVSRTTIKRVCMKIYEGEKVKLKRELVTQAISRISLTSDLWTASNQRKGYMSLTAHYVDAEWRLCKRIINFRYLAPPHSGLMISDCIHRCLMEWGIEKKISTITLDNASANDSVIMNLRNQFRATSDLYFGGKIFHVRCCAHILNLIVQEGLKTIDPTIENIRESVKYIRGSPSRLHVWNEIVKRLNLSTQRTMKLDVTTRWNSTFEMLDSAIDLRLAFSHYAQRDSAYVWLPSEDDWSVAESVRKFLFVFYNSTKKFSGSKYPTSNIFLPELWKVKDALHKGNTGQDFLHFMTMGMQVKFDKYWSECSLVMGVAVVLDPRYKMIMIDFICSKLYGAMGVAEAEKISDAVSELYNLYVCTAKEQSSHVGSSSAVDESQEDTIDDFMSYYAQRKGTQIRMPRSELEEYLNEDLLVVKSKGDDFDILEWWRTKSGNLQYPVLSLMARDILSIPISTVASESAFSTGSRVVSKYRSSLTPESVEALICSQDWLRPMWGKENSVDEEFDEEESEKIDETVPATAM